MTCPRFVSAVRTFVLNEASETPSRDVYISFYALCQPAAMLPAHNRVPIPNFQDDPHKFEKQHAHPAPSLVVAAARIIKGFQSDVRERNATTFPVMTYFSSGGLVGGVADIAPGIIAH